MVADTTLTRPPKRTNMTGQWKGRLRQRGPSWRGQWWEYFLGENGTRTRRRMSKTIALASGPGAVSKQQAQRIFWDTVLSKLPGALSLNRCPIKQVLPKSLASKIGSVTAESCFPWIGAKVNGGYGKILFNGKLQLAHRVVYEIMVGLIPEGLCVLHRCDYPPCVNPKHLFLGTSQDNTDDMLQKKRHRSQVNAPHLVNRAA